MCNQVKETIKYLRNQEDILDTIDTLERKESIIKNKFNDHLLANNLCFLLGSGCSVGAINLMSKTFSDLKATNQRFKDKKILGDFQDDNNIEAYLNWLSKIIEIFPPDKTKKYREAFKETKQALMRSINIDCLSKLDVFETYKSLYNNIFEHRIISNISNPVNIFTTNYDLFNEYALEDLGIHYFNGFTGSVNRKFNPDSFNLRIVDEKNRYKDRWSPIKRLVRLYKIHGSIDWIDTENGIIQSSQKINENEAERVIIYPTISKLFETQQTPYSELFREFSIKLQEKNTTLIVIGYGFSDSHVNNLITQALSKDDFTLIIFSDLQNNAGTFYQLHKTYKNIHIITGKEDNKHAHYFSYIVNNLILKGE